MTDLHLTGEQIRALEFHLDTLDRRRQYLLQNAQNGFSLREAASLTFVVELLCPVVEGCSNGTLQ